MKQDSKFAYPVTKETLHNYAESIFKPIIRGECVTTVWVPMAGRRMWNKFIIENINLFEKELPNYQKYLLVYIEPLDLTEESLAGYIRLMANSFIEVVQKNDDATKKISKEDIEFIDDPDKTYSTLLSKLKEMLYEVTDLGLEVVFFVGEFDELTFANKIFYNNLKSLWSGLYPRLHYIFLMREYVVRDLKLAEWGDFNEAILQNIVYIPVLSEEDFKHVVNRMAEQMQISVSENEFLILKKYCGGHPYMLRVALRIIKSLEDQHTIDTFEKLLTEHYELRSVAKGILEVYTEKQKTLLAKVANGDNVDSLEGNELKSLEKLGILQFDGDNYALFGELFKNAIVRSNGKQVGHEDSKGFLSLDENLGTIFYKGKAVEERFTTQEYSVLIYMLQHLDKVCSRDDIGNVLWGKESYEKYSDWAIDQLISKIRKKLSNLGVKNNLVTLRGKGYKLIS